MAEALQSSPQYDDTAYELSRFTDRMDDLLYRLSRIDRDLEDRLDG